MEVLLGEDGRGYELARRLEGCGAWRSWLGDAAYASFAPALASAAAWDSFMSSKSPLPLHLQICARALLFDKASASLTLPSAPSASYSPSPTAAAAASAARSLSNVNPNFLQLHGDDVYFSLEDEWQGSLQQQTAQSSLAFSDRGFENESTSQKVKHDDFSENWYNQCIKKYRTLRNQKISYCGKESNKRTSEGMSGYLKASELNKRRKLVFKEEGVGGHVWENGSSMRSSMTSDVGSLLEEGSFFFPELMFTSNCVPDSALPPIKRLEEEQRPEAYGVLDKFPDVISRSTAMMERFGIRPEHLKMGSKYRGKDGAGGNNKCLDEEQASMMMRKVSARFLATMGFEGVSEVSMGFLSDFISDHFFKLGRKLKLLSDSYKKQFSSMELLKMFLQVAGYSNLGTLVEITKDNNKGFTQQSQQQVQGLLSPRQNPLMHSQQFQRQMDPQMNMLHPQQNLTLQQQQQLQQWEKIRQQQRQATTPRGSMMIMNKDQPLMEVKVENMDTQLDPTLNVLNKHQMPSRQPQMALTSQQVQAGQQLKQLSSSQMPQLQAQSKYGMRMPPVKVEAFHELVSGDSSLKLEPDKLTSPRK